MAGLHKLARDNDNKEEIVRLLQNGADINEQNSYGDTALWCACQNNHTEIAEILLKHKKINVNLQDFNGRSPFYGACWNYSYECSLLMLQDARVDIDMADNKGWSPLMRACYHGNTKIVQLLISFGRNIKIYKKSTEDYSGFYGTINSCSTVLDVAKQKNSTIVKLLQQYQNNQKETQKTTRNKLNLKGKKKKKIK